MWARPDITERETVFGDTAAPLCCRESARLIRARNGESNLLSQAAGKAERELVRSNMQQAARVGDAQLPKHFKGNF